jgi:hypothetical protein
VNGSIPTSPTILTLASGLKLSPHSGVAVDANGNVYFGDTGNNAIKEILAVTGDNSKARLLVFRKSGLGSSSDRRDCPLAPEQLPAYAMQQLPHG